MSKSQALIFGVPISWIAMISAILAGSSIVPLFFFAEGEGYFRASNFIYCSSGIFLFPWKNAIVLLLWVSIYTGWVRVWYRYESQSDCYNHLCSYSDYDYTNLEINRRFIKAKSTLFAYFCISNSNAFYSFNNDDV